MVFDPEKFINQKILEIKQLIGEEKAIAACSGGVDSTTCIVLAKKAIGEKLLAIYINDGFRRLNESEKVLSFLEKLKIKTRLIDAKEDFFKALKGIVDPEEKRKIFRKTFYEILGKTAKEEEAKFLIQGTIAADVIETVKGIKTQHNVLEQIGINPEEFGFKIIEPLRELYKPQVRMVARALKLPKEIVYKMPFPGPGLMIRTLGEVTPEKVEIVRKATDIVEKEIKNIKSFQSFAVVLNDKATGIINNERNYGYIIVIRIVSSKDAITAKALNVSFKTLKKISNKILKGIPEVCRCLYDITDKPPATIEFE